MVCALSGSGETAKRIAAALEVKPAKITASRFPDGEVHLRFGEPVEGKDILLVRSLHPEPNDGLIEIVFAARTARELGAKSVYALIPYLAYMRQDRRFEKGECISAVEMARLLNNCLDGFVTVDPHLHRIKSLREIFSIRARRLSADPVIAAYIKKNYKKEKTLIVGPDIESSQWAKRIADSINFESTIFLKERLGSRDVKVRVEKELAWKGKKVVIVDDIVSTGGTMAGAIKEILKRKAASVDCICVHPIMAEDAYGKLKKAGAKKIVSCNTIEHRSNAIDISRACAAETAAWREG
jgi:ribose-phosphate pyrophosphokinase